MVDPSKKGLRRATIVFWFLLCYIIAALLWWLISLEQQNRRIHDLQRSQAPLDQVTQSQINRSEQRNNTKYIAEGVTFLLLILFGAVYIYRLVRQQFQLQQQQQNFVMAVTHELKTPIAVARLNLETLQKYQLPEEKKEKLMTTTLQETNRLDTLINNILISTQLDADAYKTEKEKVNFSLLVQQVLQQFHNRYHEKQVFTQIEEEVYLQSDPLLLNLLVSNLLENANKYAQHDTAITCSLKRHNKQIIFAVKDEGTGIADAEKKKIFDKFYRIGSEHTRRAKGTGLGLYICKKIVQSQGGEITVTDNHPRGSNFTVTFNA